MRERTAKTNQRPSSRRAVRHRNQHIRNGFWLTQTCACHLCFLKKTFMLFPNRASLLRVFDTAGYGTIRKDTEGYGRIRQETAVDGRIRQDTAEYSRIRQEVVGYGRKNRIWQDTAGYGRIRQIQQDPTVYGMIQQDRTGYRTIQCICLFALRKQPFCVHLVLGCISYSSCVPIGTFLFRWTTRFAAHQSSVLKGKGIATCFEILVLFHTVPAFLSWCFCLG